MNAEVGRAARDEREKAGVGECFVAENVEERREEIGHALSVWDVRMGE